MRFALCADVHAGDHQRFGGPMRDGMNARCKAVLDAFERSVAVAVSEGCRQFIVLGDLIDTSRPTPGLLARLQGILRAALSKRIEFILLGGNHEQHSNMTNDHALAPLGEHGVTVVDDYDSFIFDDIELGLLAFKPGDAKEYLKRDIQKCFVRREKHGMIRTRLLGIHMGVKDKNTPPWLKNASDAIEVDDLHAFMDEWSVSTTFAGNWHNALEWDGVQQCGALVPTGFDNPGLTGHGDLLIYDSDLESVERVSIPGPRFVKLNTLDALGGFSASLLSSVGKNEVYLSVKVPPEDRARALAMLDSAKNMRSIVDGEVLTDGTDEKVAARGAAQAAKSTETLAEALAAFVAAMPLEAGVDRAEVLTRAKAYLA